VNSLSRPHFRNVKGKAAKFFCTGVLFTDAEDALLKSERKIKLDAALNAGTKFPIRAGIACRWHIHFVRFCL
jgi:hypothetical protein